MKPIATIGRTRELLNNYGLQACKRRGQNFLVDGNVVHNIVQAAEVKNTDTVVEIGPGLGALTEALVQTGAEVLALEIDRKLAEVVESELKGYKNLRVLVKDALKADLDKLVSGYCCGSAKYKVVGNLPYYITSALLKHFLENGKNISEMVFMMQKEVAQRVTASPGSRDYGVLTVAVNFYCETDLVARVPSTVFYPAPEVDSSVVKFIKRTFPPVDVKDTRLFFNVIKAAFSKRRKTLLNSLSSSLKPYDKKEWAVILELAGVNPETRAEQLCLGDFARIANTLTNRGL